MNRFRLYSLTGALVLMLAMVSSPAMAQGRPPGGEEAGSNLSIPCVTAVVPSR